MAKMTSNQLIDDLLVTTKNSTQAVQKLKQFELLKLSERNAPNEWSILECIEHLNLYGSFYLPAIEKAILSQKTIHNSCVFKSGILGNYFVNLVKLKQAKIKKMSTAKTMDPFEKQLTITTIDRFLKQQERLKSLLEQARYVDITKAKTPISISRFIKLRLGDILRFMVYHIERHVAQANKIHSN
ncbi:DinB family protein [Pedobacter sp. ok626]|uniref:DinB family protein n=1 Tax=Pedobacter sp. ok626 TaxID=1761882 RepID=UPI000B86447B|nr:DinB family protein [Pedobacter sp. ok626]